MCLQRFGSENCCSSCVVVHSLLGIVSCLLSITSWTTSKTPSGVAHSLNNGYTAAFLRLFSTSLLSGIYTFSISSWSSNHFPCPAFGGCCLLFHTELWDQYPGASGFLVGSSLLFSVPGVGGSGFLGLWVVCAALLLAGSTPTHRLSAVRLWVLPVFSCSGFRVGRPSVVQGQ